MEAKEVGGLGKEGGRWATQKCTQLYYVGTSRVVEMNPKLGNGKVSKSAKNNAPPSTICTGWRTRWGRLIHLLHIDFYRDNCGIGLERVPVSVNFENGDSLTVLHMYIILYIRRTSVFRAGYHNWYIFVVFPTELFRVDDFLDVRIFWRRTMRIGWVNVSSSHNTKLRL